VEWLNFKLEFGHIKPSQCFGKWKKSEEDPSDGEWEIDPKTERRMEPCRFFGEHYLGIETEGSSCMHRHSILRFQQAKNRPCPLVLLEPDNDLASDLLWIAMAPRLNPFFEAFRTQLERVYGPIRVIRALRRAINAMQQPEALDAMGYGKKPTSSQRPSSPVPRARTPRPRGARPGIRRRPR
jgi:hypothetical protein